MISLYPNCPFKEGKFKRESLKVSFLVSIGSLFTCTWSLFSKKRRIIFHLRPWTEIQVYFHLKIFFGKSLFEMIELFDGFINT
jgi:hypothetical protein